MVSAYVQIRHLNFEDLFHFMLVELMWSNFFLEKRFLTVFWFHFYYSNPLFMIKFTFVFTFWFFNAFSKYSSLEIDYPSSSTNLKEKSLTSHIKEGKELTSYWESYELPYFNNIWARFVTKPKFSIAFSSKLPTLL